MRRLDVYVNDRKAGMLTEKYPGGGYCFQYETDYFLSDAPSISVTLSKRNKIYESALLCFSSRICFLKEQIAR